jgi:hypothetical protein
MNGGAARRHAEVRRQAESPVAARHMTPIERGECLRLLGSVPLGRLVFTKGALPAIRPVNHIVADDSIVIRTHEGATLSAVTAGASVPGAVVAYEADTIDPDTHLGWSVVVTGYAQLVTDPDELHHYEQLLRPWVDAPWNHTVRIAARLVTGFRLTEQLPVSQRSTT